MKKIVEEIIENTPELENNKEKLSKTVDFLDENNPDIRPTKQFKKTLKNRLQGLINLKQNKKSKFGIFAIPVFSAMFVVAGFMYFYDDINFLNTKKDSQIRLKEINKVSENDLQAKEINEIGEMFEEELEKVILEEQNKEENTEVVNDEIVPKVMPAQTRLLNTEKSQNDNLEINEPSTKEESSTEILEKDVGNDGSIEAEDNQIMEIFEALEEEYPEEFSGDEIDSGNSDFSRTNSFKSSGGVQIDIEESIEFMQFDMMLYDEVEITFSEYCENEGGEVSGSGELEKCIVDKKECLASEFENGVCEFKEIK